MAKSAAQMVAEAKGRIENLSVDQVAEEVGGGDALLVDLREPEERRRDGVIPDAIPVSRGMLEFYADPTSPYHRPEFDPSKRVIFHCAGGGRSALAADTLKQLGFDRAAHLEGGFAAWKAEGQPVADAPAGAG